MDVHCHCHRQNYPEILENYGYWQWTFWFQWLYHIHNKRKQIAFAITAEMSTKNINPDWKAILYWCSCRSQRTSQKMFEKYIFCVTMTQVVDSTHALQNFTNNQMLSFAIVLFSFLTGASPVCDILNPFWPGGRGQICPNRAQTRIPLKINGWKFW